MKLEFARDPKAKELRVMIATRERTTEMDALVRRIVGGESIVGCSERGGPQAFPLSLQRQVNLL